MEPRFLTGPKKIIILRHAEKPSDKKIKHLSPIGYARAAALAPVFIEQFGSPTTIYAAKPKRLDSSVRSIETITPLSSISKVPIYGTFCSDQLANLVNNVLTNPRNRDGLIVICWPHKNIQHLCNLLKCLNPPAWDSKVFDQYWVIDYSKSSKLTIKSQKLLYGDN
jgi:hypothetical protein